MRLPGAVLVVSVITVVVVAAVRSCYNDATEDSGSSSAQESRGRDKQGAGETTLDVAVTFDDGPHPEYTPQILDTLADHNARAVFCVLGVQAERYPDLIRRIVDERHVLCSHSYDHDADLKYRSDAEITADLTRTAKAISDAAPGAVVSYFRQPNSYVSNNVAEVAESFDYRPLNWTIDTRDWEQPGERAIVRTVKDHLGAEAVIIMHDGGGERVQTVEALPGVLDAIDDAGLGVSVPARPLTPALVSSWLRTYLP